MYIRSRGLEFVLVATALILALPARADNIVANGDSGWSVFTTANGTNGGAGLPDVVPFNTTGGARPIPRNSTLTR